MEIWESGFFTSVVIPAFLVRIGETRKSTLLALCPSLFSDVVAGQQFVEQIRMFSYGIESNAATISSRIEGALYSISPTGNQHFKMRMLQSSTCSLFKKCIKKGIIYFHKTFSLIFRESFFGKKRKKHEFFFFFFYKN